VSSAELQVCDDTKSPANSRVNCAARWLESKRTRFPTTLQLPGRRLDWLEPVASRHPFHFRAYRPFVLAQLCRHHV